MNRRFIQRGLIAGFFTVAGLAAVSDATPASAAAAARCRKPCPSTSTSTTTATSTTTTTAAPTTTTTTAPATTTTAPPPPSTTTTVPATTSTTVAPAPVCTDGSTPLDATTTSEGARIRICTNVGNWTASTITAMLQANGLDLHVVGPRLTIEVSTARPSSTGSSASCCDVNDNYYGFRSVVSLNPSATSSFANAPDAVLAHEYGHAWTSYWLYATNGGSWAAYRNARWVTADGSQVLAQSVKLNSSYNWTDHELAADDYRRLFGSPAAQSQLAYLNANVPDPHQQPGLGGFFLESWR